MYTHAYVCMYIYVCIILISIVIIIVIIVVIISVIVVVIIVIVIVVVIIVYRPFEMSFVLLLPVLKTTHKYITNHYNCYSDSSVDKQ